MKLEELSKAALASLIRLHAGWLEDDEYRLLQVHYADLRARSSSLMGRSLAVTTRVDPVDDREEFERGNALWDKGYGFSQEANRVHNRMIEVGNEGATK